MTNQIFHWMKIEQNHSMVTTKQGFLFPNQFLVETISTKILMMAPMVTMNLHMVVVVEDLLATILVILHITLVIICTTLAITHIVLIIAQSTLVIIQFTLMRTLLEFPVMLLDIPEDMLYLGISHSNHLMIWNHLAILLVKVTSVLQTMKVTLWIKDI